MNHQEKTTKMPCCGVNKRRFFPIFITIWSSIYFLIKKHSDESSIIYFFANFWCTLLCRCRSRLQWNPAGHNLHLKLSYSMSWTLIHFTLLFQLSIKLPSTKWIISMLWFYFVNIWWRIFLYYRCSKVVVVLNMKPKVCINFHELLQSRCTSKALKIIFS